MNKLDISKYITKERNETIQKIKRYEAKRNNYKRSENRTDYQRLTSRIINRTYEVKRNTNKRTENWKTEQKLEIKYNHIKIKERTEYEFNYKIIPLTKILLQWKEIDPKCRKTKTKMHHNTR